MLIYVNITGCGHVRVVLFFPGTWLGHIARCHASHMVNITMKTGNKMRGIPSDAPKINILLKIFFVVWHLVYNKTLI